VAASLATVAVIAIVVWRWRAPEDGERFVVRWFGLGLLWSVLFLTMAGLVPVGLGSADLIREVRAPVGPAVAIALVVALLGWNLTHLPPAVHPDGGFPAGNAVASQVDATLTEQGVDRSTA